MIHHGDCLAVLQTLPEASVQCAVTSPPYWNLRDYGTAKWEGGDTECTHERLGISADPKNPGKPSANGRPPRGEELNRWQCRCGAIRVDEQIGLEETMGEYIEKLTTVFLEVRRVLKPDGVLWLNLGDSYAGSWGAQGRQGKTGELAGRSACAERQIAAAAKRKSGAGSISRADGLKPKDLCGVPWRVAFALQESGWWLRSDVIWCKGNPMPESVKDRPTRAHEYVFLMTKSERYFYDMEAVKEVASPDSHARYARGRSADHKWADGGPGNQTIVKGYQYMRKGECGHADQDGQGGCLQCLAGSVHAPGVNPKAKVPSGWDTGPGSHRDKTGRYKQDGHGRRNDGFNERYKVKQNESFSAAVKDVVEARNLRSWWHINPEPTPEAHFATYPIRLAERCILAGSKPGDTILDPFAGAGTTWLACLKHGREFVGIELNEEYIRIAEERARKHYSLLVSA